VNMENDDFTRLAVDTIKQCSSEAYIIASVPGLHASHFKGEFRRLKSVFDTVQEWDRLVIPYGLGNVDSGKLIEAVKTCGSDKLNEILVQDVYDAGMIWLGFIDLDDDIANILSQYKDYTLIILGNPALDSQALDSQMVASNDTEIVYQNGLFHRYQFFTPGIMMGFMTAIVLIPIGYIAITLLHSIQIPYRSFDFKAATTKKNQ
jgi:hypothetical protein